MIKVSVIVPVYNVEKYLKRCIESVLNQSYDNIELILVDDGSTDTSGAMCDYYRDTDSRVKVIHKENGGVSSARNVALDIAIGDYLMFLDSDDALDLDAIEYCVQSTENAKWDIVLYGFHMYSESAGSVFFQKNTVYQKEEISTKEQLNQHFSEYYRKGYLNFITDKIIRSSIVKNHKIQFNGAFDIGGEDGLFMLDVASYLSCIKVTSRAFYQYYRRANESITQIFRPEKFDRYYDRVKYLYGFMIEQNCFDGSYLVELLGSYFLWAYESTFHPSCDLSLFERLRYIRNTFRKKDVFPEQRRLQKQITDDLSAYVDYSKSSLIALRLFYKRHFLLLSIWNVLTAIKLR